MSDGECECDEAYDDDDDDEASASCVRRSVTGSQEQPWMAVLAEEQRRTKRNKMAKMN